MDVTEYYERNTERFIRFGVGKGEYAIHRQIWGPGVRTPSEALHYAEDLIVERLAERSIAAVFDLGCGVGGTIRYLASRHPAIYRGMTLSPTQARIASSVVGEGVVRLGDMTDRVAMAELFEGVRKPAALICIESFIHLPEKRSWFALPAAHTTPGDLLIVQDDFLASTADPGRRGRRLLAEFEAGWKAPALMTAEEVCRRAADSGFRLLEDVDLTPFLRDRPLQRLSIAALVALGKPFRPKSAGWDNFLGGSALGRCIRSGITSYRQLQFVRE
jgi:hypothetical protein